HRGGNDETAHQNEKSVAHLDSLTFTTGDAEDTEEESCSLRDWSSASSASSVVTRSFAGLLAQMPVHQFFDELHAPEFHNLCVLFQSAIEEHADLPRSREHVRILDGRFIEEMVRARGGVTFDNVQGVAVEISRAIEPGLVVETRGVNDQRFSFPVSVRPSHPAVSGRLLVFIHIDGAHRP